MKKVLIGFLVIGLFSAELAYAQTSRRGTPPTGNIPGVSGQNLGVSINNVICGNHAAPDYFIVIIGIRFPGDLPGWYVVRCFERGNPSA